MRPLPYLGDVRDEREKWSCGYATAPERTHCLRDATWHGFLLDDPAERIVAMMSSCDGHLGHMKLSADYVHPMKHPCGIPGSSFRWPENECYTEWDEAAEFTAAELVTAST
jgi:hypothetical protein